MPTLPSKQELKSMMYRDLQKICKDWGVRANLKSDEMIDLLLEAQLRNAPGPASTSAFQPPVRPRSVSTRLSTTRAGPARSSSVIIHDIPGETNSQGICAETVARLETVASTHPPPAPPTRNKKAKELQKRLGVGKPVVAGGTGARAVTQLATAPRERIRSSRNKQVEATIQEESEPPSASDTQQTVTASPQQPRSSSLQGGITPKKDETTVPDFERLLSAFVKPLQDQIDTLRAEVKRLQALETEVRTLDVMVRQAESRQINDEAQVWETTFGTRKQSMYLVEPSTPPTTFNVQLPSGHRTLMPSPQIIMPKGTTPALLGKRQRGSSINESLVVRGEDLEGISPDASSPARKRPRLSGEGSSNKGKEVDREEVSRDNTSTISPRAAGFVVYNDPEEGEFLPPTNHLPDYYASRLNGPRGPGQGFSTSSTNAPENQIPFNHSLPPEPLTPGPTMFAPAFPYPEPPQSPTPAGTSLLGSLSIKDDRSDVFKTFGLPPPDRARRLPPGSSNGVTDPAVLSHPSGKQRLLSVDESHSTLGLTPSTSAGSDPNSEKPLVASKKTMYGTELEGDNRFGDFGVEGVAMGFWTGGRF